jgi:ketoreductase RED2
MTALLAKVVGPDVRVNAVAPGLVDTPWTEDWDTVRGFVSEVAPLKRAARPGRRRRDRGAGLVRRT